MSRVTLLILSIILLYSNIWAQKQYEIIRELSIENNGWKVFQSQNLSRKKYKGKWVYELSEQRYSNPQTSDLYLDFEQPVNKLDNYRVIHSEYQENNHISQSGSQSGKFYFSKHYLSLLPLQTSIFSPGSVPGSFTIEFWLYLYQPFDYQYVLDYIGSNPTDTTDKNNYGMSIMVKDRKLHFQFENFFWNLEQEPYSWNISENDRLSIHKWEHHAVSFNIMTGKLTTYKNGIEQEVQWVTKDSRILSPIFNPLIQEELSTPVIIGRNAFFSLDDLKISRSSLDDFYLHKFVNKPARLDTQVYKISDNISRLKKLDFDVEKPQYAYIKYAYRVSDEYFLSDDENLSWVYIQDGVESFPPLHSSGKYIQYKILAYPHPDSIGAIRIKGIHLKFHEDASPESPIFLSAKPGSGQVELSWIPTTEEDVVAYEIYYGNQHEQYICDDSSQGPSPLRVNLKQQGKLQAFNYTLKGLRNETPYFISIRSVDANGNRSVFSREIYVRPGTVFNSDAYSVGE